MDYKEIYESWLSNPYFDEDTKDELRAIAEDENEIKERFYIRIQGISFINTPWFFAINCCRLGPIYFFNT